MPVSNLFRWRTPSCLSQRRPRKVTETRDVGTEVEVSDGVKQGDQVVLSPPVDLDDGSKVQVRATPTAKPAS